MSVDLLQDKIRKLKNPSMIDLTVGFSELPPHLLEEEGSKAKAYGRFCREILEKLAGTVPAVRFSFTPFVILGAEGLSELKDVLQAAAGYDYYVVLDGPDVLSPMMAADVADAVFGDPENRFPCDGMVLSIYPGTDCVKPFLPYCKRNDKDLFAVVRTSNKTAPEIQDLLTGSRLVHLAVADLINRFGGETLGKCGYSHIGAVAGGSSAESLRLLRSKYPTMFLLVDDIDYSSCNAKICSNAFDEFGHGAVVCAGPTVTAAWKIAQTDGRDYLDQAEAAADRLKKNLTRYKNIM